MLLQNIAGPKNCFHIDEAELGMKTTCWRRYERKGRLCRDCPVPALLARRNGQEPRQRADTQTLLARLVSHTTAFWLVLLKRGLKSAFPRRCRRCDRLQ